AALFAPGAAHLLSALLLCGMGAWMLAVGLRERAPEWEPGSVFQSILSNPTRADRDSSLNIDFGEATLLGIALSINNIGGGIGAGLALLSPFWTAAASAVISFAVLWLGAGAGRALGTRAAGRRVDRAAGILLIVVGLLQLR